MPSNLPYKRQYRIVLSALTIMFASLWLHFIGWNLWLPLAILIGFIGMSTTLKQPEAPYHKTLAYKLLIFSSVVSSMSMINALKPNITVFYDLLYDVFKSRIFILFFLTMVISNLYIKLKYLRED